MVASTLPLWKIIQPRTGLTAKAFFFLCFSIALDISIARVRGFPVDIVRRWPIAEVTTLKYMRWRFYLGELVSISVGVIALSVFASCGVHWLRGF